MCGRINLSDNEGVQALMAMLGVPLLPEQTPLTSDASFQPRWNISPSATLSALVADSMNDRATLNNTTMRWGLEAPWSEPGKGVRRLINARSETLLSKPTFRDLAKHHRTVIPVNGFYEWKREGDDRIPYYIQVQELPAMLLAAVYQPMSAEDIAKEMRTLQANAEAKAKAKKLANAKKAENEAKANAQMGFLFDDEPSATSTGQVDRNLHKSLQENRQNSSQETTQPLETAATDFTGDFAVVTTQATNAMADIHHRAPVMLNVEQAMRWLHTEDPAEIESLSAPESIMEVSVRRVSRAVNSSRNDGPECVGPPEED